jgi:AAA+ ATPase superfamily predicted ATPase
MCQMKWDFYGRQDKLATLRQLLNNRRWFFVRVQGRRRIGKTELLKQLARADAQLEARLVYMQVPDSDERDVVFTFKRALLECEPPAIKDLAPSVVDFPSMARAIADLCANNVVVVLDEFQYFVRHTLYSFNSFLQAEIDKLRDTAKGGLLVLGSIQTEMQALLNDKGAPLYGRATHHLEVEHWDFEDLVGVFRAQGIEDPRAWLTLWSFFEGVPKFYRDAHDFGVLQAEPAQLGRQLIQRLFLEGSSPLRDEAENWFLRELQGRNVSILTYLADNPGCYMGDMGAALTKTNNSAELGPYVTNLINKYKMVEKRLPVFSDARSRNARYYLTDNFLEACLAVTTPAVHAARIRPVERTLDQAMTRLYTHEGYAFEKLIRSLHVECSRKGKGDFELSSIELGYWNKPRDATRSIEIDVVALDSVNKKVRFGSCKRAASAHDGNALKEFRAHVDAFLKSKEGKQVADWSHELALFSPAFTPEKVAHLESKGFTCKDLRSFAALF